VAWQVVEAMILEQTRKRMKQAAAAGDQQGAQKEMSEVRSCKSESRIFQVVTTFVGSAWSGAQEVHADSGV
jgi:hypothetical protein